MKKTYIQPYMKAYKIHPVSFLAGTAVASGGSNSNGGPQTADSKSGFDLGFGLDNEEE